MRAHNRLYGGHVLHADFQSKIVFGYLPSVAASLLSNVVPGGMFTLTGIIIGEEGGEHTMTAIGNVLHWLFDHGVVSFSPCPTPYEPIKRI